MTLLAYKDGLLAADTGCTRSNTREGAVKLSLYHDDTLPFGPYIGVALGGLTNHMSAWSQEFVAMLNSAASQSKVVQDTQFWAGRISRFQPEQPLSCNGIVVLRRAEAGTPMVWWFDSSIDHAPHPGRMVEVDPEREPLVLMGHDHGVLAALGYHEAAPRATSAQIIRGVAQVVSVVDVKYGVDTIDFGQATPQLENTL